MPSSLASTCADPVGPGAPRGGDAGGVPGGVGGGGEGTDC